MSEQAKPMLCDDCGLPVGSGPYYHTGGRISGCHMALMAEVAALRAALDQERAWGNEAVKMLEWLRDSYRYRLDPPLERDIDALLAGRGEGGG